MSRGGKPCSAAKQTNNLPRNFRKNGQSVGKMWLRSRYFKPPFRGCNRGHCLLLVKQPTAVEKKYGGGGGGGASNANRVIPK